ncbi:MAG: PilN domain-containing protein [Proteobacteria bacterium]|nr:PilN domain-containing protein [Pseudomonadota bacterium]
MNTIEKLQNDLSYWYEDSSVGQFMRWWATQLKSFVPEKHQEKWFPESVKIYLTQGDTDILVWCKQGDNFQLYTDASDADGKQEEWWHQVQHVINQVDGRKIEIKYLICNDKALVKKIALPGAAKDNLDEVIGFELDKYVPFNAEQVQLSYKIDKENSTEDKILMDLAVMRKEKISSLISLCDEKSISLDGIDVNLAAADTQPRGLGVNLLPAEKRKAVDFNNIKLNLGLLVLLIGLVYFVMHTSIDNKQNKIDKLTEINSHLQKQARTSKLLKKELKAVIISSKFLQTKKASYPALVEILSEVTSILPNSTYVTRLKVSQDKLEITGQSDNANSLVPKLDQSNQWYTPQIGSVTSDPRTKKEKFTIKAEFKEPQMETEDGDQS